MNDTILITNYIATWGYQILAMMSLFFSLLFFSFGDLISNVFCVSLFFIFYFCEYKSLKMKQEVLEGE